MAEAARLRGSTRAAPAAGAATARRLTGVAGRRLDTSFTGVAGLLEGPFLTGVAGRLPGGADRSPEYGRARTAGEGPQPLRGEDALLGAAE